MSPNPPTSASASSAGQSPETNFRVVRKRNRIPLSCGPCRHRKLKCNRQHPCDNCTKRGDMDTCNYAAPNARKKSSVSSTVSGKLSPDEMQGRIDRLEGLVLSLMTNGSQSAGPAAASAALSSTDGGRMMRGSVSGSSTTYPIPEDEEIDIDHDESEVDKVAKSVGVMRVDNGKAFFIDENHWYSILAGISEVKNYFSDHKKQFEDQMSRLEVRGDEGRIGLGFLFSVNKPAEKAEILREFPPKAKCDVLITRFFQNFNLDVTFQIVHGPTYQRQYDAHWLNPESTSIVWLGTTYAMMVIALQSYQRAGDEPNEYSGQVVQMLRDYRRLAAQCIIFNDISSTDIGTVELLLLVIQSEAARSPDSQTGILLLSNMATRIAMRTGYHRDSKDYPAISPYLGEMRRRSWVVLRAADTLASTQFGLVPLIRPGDANTDLPRNLYDDELFEDIKELPACRPLTEPTPTCFCIYLGKMMNVFSEIVEEVQTVSAASYEKILLLDQKLVELRNDIPPIFKMRPIEESFRDPAPLVMQRILLDHTWHKIRIVLHRKFTCQQKDSRAIFSRRSAIESAIEILGHQATLHKESQPNGRLGTTRVGSSTMSQDYLIAAMVITVDLRQQYNIELDGRRDSYETGDWFVENRRKHLTAIERSLEVWTSIRETGMEAFKAFGTLSTMIQLIHSQEQKLRQQSSDGGSQRQGVNFTAPRYSATPSDDSKLAPEHSAAMTLGMLSTGAMTPNTANMFAVEANNLIAAGPAVSGAPMASMSTDVPSIMPGYFGPSDAIANPNAAAIYPNMPFNNLFGANNMMFPFANAEQQGSAFDWDALDSYMTNPSVDPAAQMNGWNMNMDQPFVEEPSNAVKGEDGTAGQEQVNGNGNSNAQQQQGQQSTQMHGGNGVWGSHMFVDPGIRG